jgi:hypothetical protein
MKPIAISSCLALAALSLYAAAPTTPQDTAAPPTTHAQTLLSAPQTIGLGDSPLVRAAKASNRLGKKPAMVITNDTLVRQGGHFTTTTPEAQRELPSVSNTTASPEQVAADAKKKKTAVVAAAEKARKAAEVKKRAEAVRAARDEGDTPEAIYSDPPALEDTVPVMKPTTLPTMGQQKPPA